MNDRSDDRSDDRADEDAQLYTTGTQVRTYVYIVRIRVSTYCILYTVQLLGTVATEYSENLRLVGEVATTPS